MGQLVNFFLLALFARTSLCSKTAPQIRLNGTASFLNPFLFGLDDISCDASLGGHSKGGVGKRGGGPWLDEKKASGSKDRGGDELFEVVGPRSGGRRPFPDQYAFWLDEPECVFASAENQKACNSCWSWAVVSALQQRVCRDGKGLIAALAATDEFDPHVAGYDQTALQVGAEAPPGRSPAFTRAIAYGKKLKDRLAAMSNLRFKMYDLPELQAFACTPMESGPGVAVTGANKCQRPWCAADAVKNIAENPLPLEECLQKPIVKSHPDYSRQCSDFKLDQEKTDAPCFLRWGIDMGAAGTGYVLGKAAMKQAILAGGPIISLLRIPRGLISAGSTFDGSQVYVPTDADRAQWSRENLCAAGTGPTGCRDAPLYHYVVNGGWGTTGGVDYWLVLNSWGNSYKGTFTLKNEHVEVLFNAFERSRGFLRIAMDPALELTEGPSIVMQPRAVIVPMPELSGFQRDDKRKI